MSNVVTIADARKIAKSKTMKMPVSYNEAVKALKKCNDLDEAKEFSNAAEALAAWARIYSQDEAGRQAKLLKLRAHRRMGELARELTSGQSRKGHLGGRPPGPIAKLQQVGLSRHNANAAHLLAKMKKREFDSLMKQPVPPSPTSVLRRFRQAGTTTIWEAIRHSQHNPFVCTSFIRNNDAAKLARSLNKGEVKFAREIAIEVLEWLDEFEQALPNE